MFRKLLGGSTSSPASQEHAHQDTGKPISNGAASEHPCEANSNHCSAGHQTSDCQLDLPKIKAIRKAVEKELELFSPNYATDFTLQRWVIYFKGNVEEIVPALKLHLAHRKLLNLDDPDLMDKYDRKEYPAVAKLAGSCFWRTEVLGGAVDREGNPTHCCGLQRPMRDICRIATFREQVLFNYYGNEYRMQVLAKAQSRDSKMRFATVIQDIDGFQLSHVQQLSDDAKVFREVMKNFPSNVGRIIFINCPFLLDMMEGVVKRIFAHDVKTSFASKGNLKPVHDTISPENLPARYGGTRSDCFDDYLKPGEAKPELEVSQIPEPAKLRVVHIKPHAELKIVVTVEKPGSQIHWWFKGNGDVEFTIFKGTELRLEDMLVPRITISTSHLPDHGSCDCDTPGSYTVYFRNNVGLLFSTKLSVSIRLESPLGGLNEGTTTADVEF